MVDQLVLTKQTQIPIHRDVSTIYMEVLIMTAFTYIFTKTFQMVGLAAIIMHAYAKQMLQHVHRKMGRSRMFLHPQTKGVHVVRKV